MLKFLTLLLTSVVGVALAGALPEAAPEDDYGAPPPPKKKGDEGPGGDLRKAYELLRRLRADNHPSGRPEERLRDWTERASQLYRDGVKAFADGDDHLAHEYGAAAHDLARAVDHSRNAALYEGRDTDLPPPPGAGREGENDRTRRDLRRAYERLHDRIDDAEGRDAKFYLDAGRDLYNAARRDAEAGRDERAGELARAAEAISHVPDHLEHAANGPPHEREKAKVKTKKGKAGPKEKEKEKEKERRKRDFEPKRPPGDGPERRTPLDDNGLPPRL